MSKIIKGLTSAITDWEGNDITEKNGSKEEVITIKMGLLRSLRSATMASGLSDTEKDFAGIAGSKIGISADSVVLEQKEYDALKKILDTNKITITGQHGNTVEMPMFTNTEMIYMLKATVNGAENYKPEKK